MENENMLNVGDIAGLIGPGIVIKSDFIENELLMPPDRKFKAARQYSQQSVATILREIAKLCESAAQKADRDQAVKVPKPTPAPVDDDEL